MRDIQKKKGGGGQGQMFLALAQGNYSASPPSSGERWMKQKLGTLKELESVYRESSEKKKGLLENNPKETDLASEKPRGEIRNRGEKSGRREETRCPINNTAESNQSRGNRHKKTGPLKILDNLSRPLERIKELGTQVAPSHLRKNRQ